MAGFELKIDGFDELRQSLEQLKTKEIDRIIKKALRAGAAVFQQEEGQRAPERPDLPSGTALPPGALKRDVVVKKVRNKLAYVIGPNKYTYKAAHLVENGHLLVKGGERRVRKDGSIRGTGKVTGHVPAHPYIRPTFEGSQQVAQDAVVESAKADLALLNYKNRLK